VPVARPTVPVDELVAVHGARLHVSCLGHGDVTVVQISGFEAAGDSWASITPAISQHARVCSYERFGDGTSDPPPVSQTFASEAADLRAALRSLDEPGPFVVVGHSFGGLEAVTFTAQFRAEVIGVLLVDASPVTWFDATCAVPDDGSAVSQAFRAATCSKIGSPANNAERLDGKTAFVDVAKIDSLGDVPVIVTTAAQHRYPGLPAGEEVRLNHVWDAGQQHWVSLSTSATLVPVDNTGHNIQHDRPDVVITQIQRLLLGQKVTVLSAHSTQSVSSSSVARRAGTVSCPSVMARASRHVAQQPISVSCWPAAVIMRSRW
jgi:pimeloyl-ACP methyl ester carboxylesterase